MERTSFDRCLTNVRPLLFAIPSLYSILFSYYHSMIITHFLLSLLFHSADTMDVSLLNEVMAAATSSGRGHGRYGGGGLGHGRVNSAVR
mmetsp:Transcript_64294/g.71873  ORF Transcript_64294/g.71873 Transcript_64294/m.71873 type:complete len:89 (+) Transcript_64294:278-544(+)